MLTSEIIDTVEVIRDPYLRATTYAKIGERLARVKDAKFKLVFLKAIETAKEIEDPVKMFRALLSIGYSMKKANLRSAKKIYQRVMEDSRELPGPVRDDLMALAARYMLGLGEISEAVIYAMEIKNPELRDTVLLQIIRRNTSLIGTERVRVAYRIRKSKMALEHISTEPFRSKALIEIMKSYFLMGSYENGIATVSQIAQMEWAKYAFKEALFFLKEHGVIEKYVANLKSLARELVEKFGDDFKIELGVAFALAGEPVEAADLVRKLGGKEALTEVALKLLEIAPRYLPPFIRALNEIEATEVGKAILNRFLEKPSEGDWETVRAIWERSRSEELKVKIARYTLVKGDLDGAMRIADTITDEKLRSIVLADISHRLLKMGDVSRAIDVAMEVRDPKFSSILIAEILIGALDREIEAKVVVNGKAKNHA
ncbi:prenyltransferase [Thermococcus profundus]|uniref:Prenyltransferase n=1 Tax=Thermococcus profundus TaxID=49899 RepID=A0A2Z2MHA3_THEPR|nr:prenyltransferase [Thermococcus profundus]